MVKYMVLEATKQLNYFPNKHGVSKYFSPRMILHQENLDYNKHCQFTFGEYVQAHNEPEPSNTNAPRSLDCLYLRSLANQQGGHELFHLQTNRVINRRDCTSVKLTPYVIRQVHELARQEGMPPGLKIANRIDNILYDSAWTAGVEDEVEVDNNEQDDDSDPEESDEESDVDEDQARKSR